MNKKILVFLLVVIGLGGIVWWQSNPNGGSPEERFARAIKLMEGLQSRAIPIEFTDDQTELLEGVYQDSIVRLPNIQGFRNTDKTKLITTLSTIGFSGTGANGLNVPGESIVTLSLARTDDFNASIDSYITALGTTTQVVKDEIKRLAQSVNTLTNDIRLTLLYMSWYETLRPTLCTTNDPNNDIYISGEVRLRYSTQPSINDSCEATGTSVKQYKCINGQYTADAAHTSVTACPEGCSNGACLRANQSGLEIIGPSTATVGTPMSIRVKAIGADGTASTSYAGTFFLIIAGDDDAEFPTGAQGIPSGQSDTTISGITFSKAGTMTLTIRDQNNLETSKTITVSAAGTTTSTTGTTTSTTTTATTSETATSGTSITTTTTSGTTTTATIAPSCTGTLPTNSTILADVGATSRAWTYDSSLTGPYQNCSFKCATGYSYVGSSCVASPTGTTGTTMTSTTTSASTTSSTGSTTSGNGTTIAPTITSISPATAHTGDSMVFTINGSGFAPANTILIREPNGNNISVTTGVFGDTSDGHSISVNSASGYMLSGTYSIQVESGFTGHPRSNTVTITVTAPVVTVTCPQYTAPGPNFCVGGQIIDGGTDANGCQLTPTCGPRLITGAVTIDGVKDCWFGDTTRRITLADLIGYQATPSTSSGLIYTDEVLLYGAAAPIANEQATNSFSYEESEWIAGEDIVATSTQLTNFFAFRTNSPGTRTWNIPTTGIKFYGCFSRDDRPTIW